MENESVLPGGFVNQVVRVGATVRRRPPERAAFVRELLALFARSGWTGAPRFHGLDEQGREILDHIEGRAAWQERERSAACTDTGLARVAALVREFHDLTAGSPLAGASEVVCHNDLSPKNTVYTVDGTGWRASAFIDWDIAAPGERVHDVGHVCWQYLGLGPDVADVRDAARRIRLICDTYGDPARPGAAVDAVLWWQDRCRRGIEAGAERGEPAMAALRDQGVVDAVRDAYAWVSEHRRTLAG